ncbi:hypothetical protein BDP55DRAFT_418164 [Colletotrichum godetiae]|uniref:Uncharacterized protein n=1 Tax=Colletotrichum godetiae TaxID=1209918 RepID=A0AAJ0A788_9PEZI|nr:uncharacterized protein BDP55DRAFT_418164 [Colletotrichum godetiae]KAK1657793.1 hypothetical protein BDP55DRAFT_418164 [Colletotrichum godetiae]
MMQLLFIPGYLFRQRGLAGGCDALGVLMALPATISKDVRGRCFSRQRHKRQIDAKFVYLPRKPLSPRIHGLEVWELQQKNSIHYLIKTTFAGISLRTPYGLWESSPGHLHIGISSRYVSSLPRSRLQSSRLERKERNPPARTAHARTHASAGTPESRAPFPRDFHAKKWSGHDTSEAGRAPIRSNWIDKYIQSISQLTFTCRELWIRQRHLRQMSRI